MDAMDAYLQLTERVDAAVVAVDDVLEALTNAGYWGVRIQDEFALPLLEAQGQLQKACDALKVRPVSA
jgi:hypothetical protein